MCENILSPTIKDASSWLSTSILGVRYVCNRQGCLIMHSELGVNIKWSPQLRYNMRKCLVLSHSYFDFVCMWYLGLNSGPVLAMQSLFYWSQTSSTLWFSYLFFNMGSCLLHWFTSDFDPSHIVGITDMNHQGQR
jgi:hypothetical protein